MDLTIIWWHGIEGDFMYYFVDEANVAPYRSYCSKVLEELRDNLNSKREINSQFILIGSGGKNMVTQNEDGPFDLDYNLRIISMPDEYWNDLKKLKDTIRNELNKIVGKTLFSDGQDSKSVITSRLVLNNDEQVFSFDIAILAENKNGNLCRLLHNKLYGQFTWNEVPNSHNVKDKADLLKRKGRWNEVRQTYLDLKNMYLSRNDNNHPSFIVYVEAVNQIYNKYWY